MIKKVSLLQNKIVYEVGQVTRPAEFSQCVAFCVDNKYLPFALFVCKQILSIETQRRFDLCVCLPDLQRVPKSFLDSAIRFIEMNIKGGEQLPVDHLSLSAYARLFLPNIFSDEYDLITYLDADIYINLPFYQTLTKVVAKFDPSFCVAAAPDITEINLRIKRKQALTPLVQSYLDFYHDKGHLYRNSGVLVFNVKNYVKNAIASRVFEVAFNPSSNLRCHDQSALNIALAGEMPILPFEFNWQLHDNTYRLIDNHQPFIIHFIGTNKPWIRDDALTDSYRVSYRDYLQHYFPDISFNPQTPAQLRKRYPKHKNDKKENMSVRLATLTAPITAIIKSGKYFIIKNKRIIHAIADVNNDGADRKF